MLSFDQSTSLAAELAAELAADESTGFSPALRVLLVVGSLVTMGFMLWRIRSSKVQIRDSVSWIVFSLLLLVLSIFPEIATYASIWLGIQSPINFVYLFIIFLLLIKLFSATLRISRMDARLQQLAQRIALDEKAQREAAESRPPTAPAQEDTGPDKTPADGATRISTQNPNSEAPPCQK